MVNNSRLIRLTRKLIAIDSQNPPGDENRIGLFVQAYLKKLGVKSRIYVFKKRRPNVVAALAGEYRKKSLLITPHLDTVPAGRSWKVSPFAGIMKRGRLYGLGATDCKGNLACALEAINSIVEDGTSLNYNLIFAATADEEAGSGLGLIRLLEKGILRPDAALVLDADDFDIIVTQKGLIHLKVKIEGRRAHGAYPWRGVNAIDKSLSVLTDLKARRPEYAGNKYLRPPTVNIGTIRGGDKVNVVADWCEFELDFRFLPGGSAQGIIDSLKALIRRHTRKFKVEVQGIQQPYSIDDSHPLISSLVQAMRALKVKPRLKGSEGATVITFFQKEKIPAVATGFGRGGCAHTADEFIEAGSLYRGARVLERFLKNYA